MYKKGIARLRQKDIAIRQWVRKREFLYFLLLKLEWLAQMLMDFQI